MTAQIFQLRPRDWVVVNDKGDVLGEYQDMETALDMVFTFDDACLVVHISQLEEVRRYV